MSERPVPRRESPWGTPEEEHRQPKAHRCNDRAEDVIQVASMLGHAIVIGMHGTKNVLRDFLFSMRIGGQTLTGDLPLTLATRPEHHGQACFEGNPFKTVPGPFKLFWQCMRSKPGEEPTEPFSYLQLDPPTREVKLE
ncbi:hypothetical protein RJ639_035645 [Escallonia herrerae]|uniref:Uncharacterized protein n=1 Tax=Escallonia herrerae TaxID=1293975 RepID=A0AA89B895_9ASTE|nr:hypothetical protein RJ639_035645 [Escallonia herrerae]